MAGELKRDAVSPARLNGMLDMAKALIRLPALLIGKDDPERKTEMDSRIALDINTIYAGIVRERL